jgi:hypothetical protein
MCMLQSAAQRLSRASYDVTVRRTAGPALCMMRSTSPGFDSAVKMALTVIDSC